MISIEWLQRLNRELYEIVYVRIRITNNMRIAYDTMKKQWCAFENRLMIIERSIDRA